MAAFFARFLLLMGLIAPFSSRTTICDDGQYGVDSDLGGEENWTCMKTSFSPKPLYLPAGAEECSSVEAEPTPVCMQETLTYQDQPPSQGAFRQLAPKLGEYHYLPPQRWLHTVSRGGVAFLYHPCAYSEQVDQLKELARSCLNQYIVSPYPHLSEESPLAVVTWGCVYRLRWVSRQEIKAWLLTKEIQTTADPEEEVYSRGLLSEVHARAFDSLCEAATSFQTTISGDHNTPSSKSPPTSSSSHGNSSPGEFNSDTSETDASKSRATPSTVPPCPAQNAANVTPPCIDHTIRTLHQHRKGLTVLVVLLGVVLLGFLLLLVFKTMSAWARRRPRNQKYKSISRYFPFSYDKQTTAAIIIPEMGMPKSGAAEREVLLASDEDEL